MRQLNSIDNMRVDGKFEINKDIPEGQAAVADLLAECFELNYELRVEAETRAEQEAIMASSSSVEETEVEG